MDTNPPPGAVTETTLIRRYVTLNLLHYDRASLFAGRLHAVLTRRYTKGRDLYDLFWYLAARDWPSPNLTLLNSALKQTGGEGPEIDISNWKFPVLERVKKMNWGRVLSDLRPFLERQGDLKLLTRENVLQLLSSGE